MVAAPFPNAFPNVNLIGGTYDPQQNLQMSGGAYTGGGQLIPTSNQNQIDPSALASMYQSQLGLNDASNAQSTLADQLQLALSQQSNTNQTNQLNQQYGFDLRGLDLTQAGYGIQSGALNREAALLPQLQALAQQQFNLQETGARRGAEQSTRASDSAATVRGSFTSQGHNQQLADIQSQLQSSLQQIGLGRQQSQLSYEDQLARLQDSRKQMGLMGDRLGLSREELSARLQNALDQMGSPQTLMGLLNDMFRAQQGDYSSLGSDLGQAEQFAQLGLLAPPSPTRDTQDILRTKGPQ